MADLLSFLPQLGRNLFGMAAPAPQDPSLFQPADRTTIAGMPIAPLITGGLGALLFNRLAKKGYGRQAALQGFGLGQSLGNAPILQEQAREDAIVGQGLQSGTLQPAQAPVMGTPAATPSFRYGGMALQQTPTVPLSTLFKGLNLDPAVGASQVPATAKTILGATPIVEALRREEELKQFAKDQNLPAGLPAALIPQQYALEQRIKRAPDVAALLANRDPNTRVSVQYDADGIPRPVLQSAAPAEVTRQALLDQQRAEEVGANRALRQGAQALQEGQQTLQGKQLDATIANQASDSAYRTERLNLLREQNKKTASKTIRSQIDVIRAQQQGYRETMKSLDDGIGGVTNQPLFDETLAKLRNSNSTLENLSTVLNEKMAEEEGLPAPAKAAEPTPEEKTMGGYLQQIIGMKNPTPENIMKVSPPPKNPAERAMYDKTNEYVQQSTAEPLQMIREHYASRGKFSFGLDPEFEKAMKLRFGWRYDVAKKMWENK